MNNKPKYFFEKDGIKKEYTLEQMIDMYEQGIRPDWSIHFKNIHELTQYVNALILLPNEYQRLVKRCKAVIKKSYDKFLNPDNAFQVATMVYDIALHETTLRILCNNWGNENLPKELKGFEPKFGISWLAKAQDYLHIKEDGFWIHEATQLIDKWDMSAKRVSSDTRFHAQMVKDVKLRIEEEHSLEIIVGGEIVSLSIEELKPFYNANSKKPNIYFQMLKDISMSLNGTLEEGGENNTAFAMSNSASNHISELSNKLDKIICIEGEQEKSLTKLWFNKIQGKNAWKPRFHMVANDLVKTFANMQSRADESLQANKPTRAIKVAEHIEAIDENSWYLEDKEFLKDS